MASKKISALSEITSINNADLLLVIQAGNPKKVQAQNIISSRVIYGSIAAFIAGTPGDADIEIITIAASTLRAVGDTLEVQAGVYTGNAVNTGVIKMKVNDAADVNRSSHASDTLAGSLADYVIIIMKVFYLTNTSCLVITEMTHYTLSTGYINTSKSKVLRTYISSGISFSGGFKIHTSAYAASGSPNVTTDYLNIRVLCKI